MATHEKFDNKEVVKRLKVACNPWVGVPSYLRFRFEDGRCTIHMPSECVCENFQVDSAAFDGWAVCVHAWLGVDVVFSWDAPADLDNQHYQRFLYRVIRLETAADWFEVSDESKGLLNSSRVLNPDGSSKEKPGFHVVNVPMKGREKELASGTKPLENCTEEELEMLFYRNSGCLFQAASLKGKPKPLRQIPIGVFRGYLSRLTRVFTGGTSMVDLGALCEDKKVALFELKKMGNRKVGALSEILFYSNVIRDVQEKTFGYPYGKVGPTENEILHSDGVLGFILAPELHPLLRSETVFSSLNEAFSYRKQEFGFINFTGTPDEITCVREY